MKTPRKNYKKKTSETEVA